MHVGGQNSGVALHVMMQDLHFPIAATKYCPSGHCPPESNGFGNILYFFDWY
jgi:hypothetical protein